jgi:four helix bundle protein
MTILPHASGFRELLVYQKTRELAKTIYVLTAAFPKEEMYSLTSQIRRSSRSVGANIAEAWAKRRYEKHFVSKLTDADGEQQETQHWIDTAADCGYWTIENATGLRQKCEEIGRLLGGMLAKASMFCGEAPTAVRESSSEYFTESEQSSVDSEQ